MQDNERTLLASADLEISRLRRLNGWLAAACLGFAVLSYILVNRPHISITEDYLVYNPGLWWDDERSIYVYYSGNEGSLSVGYFDEEYARLFDISRISYVGSAGEAVEIHRHRNLKELRARMKLESEYGLR